MSLTRVSSTDQFERDDPSSGLEHRRMSFNPVTDWIPPKDSREPLNAASVLEFEEISKSTRYGELYRPLAAENSMLTGTVVKSK